MESFEGRRRSSSSSFCYNPMADDSDANPDGAGEGRLLSGVLNIFIHHARNIHNICIYDDQDVYAKFSLTSSPDDALSTRVAAAGGRNPRFDEHLALDLALARPDALLKCELWMLSRAPALLHDQLLGFTLVPLSAAAAAGAKLTGDFTLSSTDLFHSPAGTVRLTLSLDAAPVPAPSSPTSSSIASEVVLLDPTDYSRVEFPDVNVASENQKMVSEYFDMAARSSAARAAAAPGPVPFLRLGHSLEEVEEDYDMAGGESNFSSTATSLSDERNSADSPEKNKSHETADRRSGGGDKDSTEVEAEKGGGVEMGSVFESPLGGINLEAEQSAMQQQIVDMYMRSMQQFTESLAKMKLPMDLTNPEAGNVIQSQSSSKLDAKNKKNKDGPRVFYGSRAFF